MSSPSLSSVSTDEPIECFVPLHSVDDSQKQSDAFVFTARWIDAISELEALKEKWVRLQENALYANAAFEYSYLLPAFKHLATGAERLLVVEKSSFSSESSDAQDVLVGLMPCVKKRIFGLPLKGIEIWKHDQAFDTTPLLHVDFAHEAWQTALTFLGDEKQALLSLDTVSGESGFESVLQAAQDRLSLSRFARGAFERAALHPAETADRYTAAHFSKSGLKNQRRIHKKLAALGEVKYEVSNEGSDWDFLTTEFLRLEASGWKGRNGTALSSDPKTEAFFIELIKESAAAGKARFVTLSLDGTPIAMLSDIAAGKTLYCYKTAFDDQYKKHSPGKQCEMKNVELLHDTEFSFVDSCTDPDNETINKIWGQKLKFQNVVFSLGSGVSKHFVKMLPLAQKTAQTLRGAKSKAPIVKPTVPAKGVSEDQIRTADHSVALMDKLDGELQNLKRDEAAGSSIRLTALTTIEEFAQLEDDWNRFNVDPMNSFDWNFSWWKSFQSHGKLHVIKFERSGKVVGIAPFYKDRWFGLERLRFIASGKTCSDYVEVICDPADRQEIDSLLGQYLIDLGISVVELECTNDDRLAQELSNTLQEQYRCDARLMEPCWHLELPGTWEEFLSSRRSSLRRKIRKAMKRIDSDEFVISSTADGASVEESFDAFKDLHQERQVSKNEAGVFSDMQFEVFLKDALTRLCKQQKAEIFLLQRGSETIGAQVYLNAGSGYQFYQSGYSKDAMKFEAGHLMFAEVIKRGIERGDVRYDFLRGDEPYKDFWGATPVSLRKFRLMSHRKFPSLVSHGVEFTRDFFSTLLSKK